MIRPDRYSVPQLAKLWGVDPDQIELYALNGLQIQALCIDGDENKQIRFVAAEEADRFAAERAESVGTKAKAMRSDERETWLQLVAFLLPHYTGSGPPYGQPHAIAALMLKDAEAGGLDFLSRSDDTLAAFVHQALELRGSAKPRKAMRPALSAAKARAIQHRDTTPEPSARAS
jgi:hypothetical protein